MTTIVKDIDLWKVHGYDKDQDGLSCIIAHNGDIEEVIEEAKKHGFVTVDKIEWYESAIVASIYSMTKKEEEKQT